MDLALNNLQWLIFHKTQPKQTNKQRKNITEKNVNMNDNEYNSLTTWHKYN